VKMPLAGPLGTGS